MEGGFCRDFKQRKEPDEMIQVDKIWRDDIHSKVRLLNRFSREGSKEIQTRGTWSDMNRFQWFWKDQGGSVLRPFTPVKRF